MGRPKGSKNKPKVIQVGCIKGNNTHTTEVLFKGTKPADDKTLLHWNKTIQKLNEMKENEDWTEIPAVVIDTVPETIVTTIQNNSEQAIPKKKGKSIKSDDDKYPHCGRCGCVVKHEPWRADLNVLTGRADYHRQTPRYVKLCSSCSMELSNLVDKWLLDGGCEKKIGY